MNSESRISLDIPKYDQNTFYGRLLHFFGITDWRLCLKSNVQLNEAKELLVNYREGSEPEGTTTEDIYEAKRIYESAFHPDSGELQNIFGRMSCQVPGGMIITGAMLTFYKTNSAVILWQWVNQSFNALVNYTNRNANSPLTVNQMGIAYVSATSAALVTALGLKKVLARSPSKLLQRFVPLCAVAAANCVNIPCMRQNEIMNGITVTDQSGKPGGESKLAAVKGISQVTFCRILMAAPGMMVLPIVMNALDHRKLMRGPKSAALFQTMGVGLLLSFTVPITCSLFPQKCQISTSLLEKFEPASFESIKMNYHPTLPDKVYFNKGL